MSSSQQYYNVLDWDSRFFGRKIARWSSGQFLPTDADAALEQGRQEGVECVYCLISGEEQRSIRNAGGYGLTLVDVRLTFFINLGEWTESVRRGCETRSATTGDVPALKAIAAVSHEQSRFYADGHFSSSLCSLFYQIWIEKSCAGRSERVLVAVVDGVPVGYVTCDRGEGGVGQIGLLAVSEKVRGRGIGRQLIQDALAWFHAVGVGEVRVVTQGANCTAQRAYQSAGFRSQALELWYHWWLLETAVK